MTLLHMYLWGLPTTLVGALSFTIGPVGKRGRDEDPSQNGGVPLHSLRLRQSRTLDSKESR